MITDGPWLMSLVKVIYPGKNTITKLTTYKFGSKIHRSYIQGNNHTDGPWSSQLIASYISREEYCNKINYLQIWIQNAPAGGKEKTWLLQKLWYTVDYSERSSKTFKYHRPNTCVLSVRIGASCGGESRSTDEAGRPHYFGAKKDLTSPYTHVIM